MLFRIEGREGERKDCYTKKHTPNQIARGRADEARTFPFPPLDQCVIASLSLSLSTCIELKGESVSVTQRNTSDVMSQKLKWDSRGEGTNSSVPLSRDQEREKEQGRKGWLERGKEQNRKRVKVTQRVLEVGEGTKYQRAVVYQKDWPSRNIFEARTFRSVKLGHNSFPPPFTLSLSLSLIRWNIPLQWRGSPWLLSFLLFGINGHVQCY